MQYELETGNCWLAEVAVCPAPHLGLREKPCHCSCHINWGLVRGCGLQLLVRKYALLFLRVHGALCVRNKSICCGFVMSCQVA